MHNKGGPMEFSWSRRWERLRVGVLCAIGFVLVCLQARAGEVNIYAAASMTDAVSELAKRYHQLHPAVIVKPVYAASSTLARQIAQGAPADIFLSADQDWADYLDQRGLFLAGSRRNLLGNELVMIAPIGATFAVTMAPGFNLAGSFQGRWCAGEPASVPAGKYARQALEYFGWWAAMAPRLVGAEDVRTAAAFVERGECALGVVYSTDAKMARQVAVIATFPAQSHKPIVYPGALLKDAGADSRAFWAYLQGTEARSVFTSFGFSLPNP